MRVVIKKNLVGMSNLTDKNRLSIVRPDLAAEWHPTKNGRLSPEDISYGSKKKIC